MPTSVRIALVVLSTCFSAASVIPAIWQTARGNIRPRIVTWLTWSLLTGVAGAASASVGDYPSAAFSLIGTVVTGAVVIAGLRYGDRSLATMDVVCLVLVVAGFVLWLSLDVPGVAVAAACVIDFIGLIPTLVHAWRQPWEEPPATYALIAIGGACATGAAWGTWTVTAIAYPIYVLLSMGACWSIVVLRRRFRPAEPAGTEHDLSSIPILGGDSHAVADVRDELAMSTPDAEATTRLPVLAPRPRPWDWPPRSPNAARFKGAWTDDPTDDEPAALPADTAESADTAEADGAVDTAEPNSGAAQRNDDEQIDPHPTTDGTAKANDGAVDGVPEPDEAAIEPEPHSDTDVMQAD
jgi:hypothetical protein